MLGSKSLYISPAVNNFYETEIEIWAGFGPDGSTEKKFGADYEQVLRAFFCVFIGNFFFKYCSIRTKKLPKMKMKKN